MRRATVRVIGYTVAATALVTIEGVALFRPASVVEAIGRRPYVVTEFAAALPVGQTLRASDDYLEAVDLRLVAERPASLDVAFRVLEWAPNVPATPTGRWAGVREGKTTLRLPQGQTWHRFAFEPISSSAARVFQFQVEQLAVRSLDGHEPGRPAVGVMASEDDALKDGNVVVGSTQSIERDLFVRVRTASAFTRFRVEASPSLPGPLRSAGVQLTLLACGDLVLILLAQYLSVFVYALVVPETPSR
jgi:hypothetical protein